MDVVSGTWQQANDPSAVITDNHFNRTAQRFHLGFITGPGDQGKTAPASHVCYEAVKLREVADALVPKDKKNLLSVTN